MKRLWEWGIATQSGGEPRVSPVGVTDKEPRARERMFEALHAVPAGVPVCGWVTVMGYVPLENGYDRFNSPVHVERDADGTLRWMAGASDD